MIKFEVLGEPVAQGRARAGKIKGRTVLFDPSKSKNYKNYVRLVASQYAPAKPLEGPLRVVIDIYKTIPKSFSKKKTAQAEAGEIRPTTKPDFDNFAKSVCDSLNGVIWKDDSQIVEGTVRKWYSEKPRVVVEVKPWRLNTIEAKG